MRHNKMRHSPWFFALGTLLAAPLAPLNATEPAMQPQAKTPRNLLFILTDQQRWDAMSCAGNTVLKTPNLDKLAKDGARFTRFYSACPVCVPARTSILTGHSPEANLVMSNNDLDKPGAPPPFLSFDQILLRSGYKGEYHGKYHSPYTLALDYTAPVRWLNGALNQRPEGSKATESESVAYRVYLDENVPRRPLKPGELMQGNSIYTPTSLDQNYGKESPAKSAQPEAYGRLEMPAEYSLAAFTAKEGIAALDRLKGQPFTLTISIGPPHPPMLVAEPYFSRYPPKTIGDALVNSPYANHARAEPAGYRDPAKIQEMTSIYYGMVSEVDDWVGRILARLDQLGLAKDTLVVFTSDHGEMLGEHGMHGKFVFYEGSVHVPLLMRLPGVIPANTVVQAPASHTDLFPTILEYLDRPGHEANGQSLKPLIEGRDSGKGRVVVSSWASKGVPAYMVTDGRWKLLYGGSANASSLDALYDLKTDPTELTNLIGRNPEREKFRDQAERMKTLLIRWLERTKSRDTEGVKARTVIIK
jgi:arylsulfatase A-like enzyme